MQISATKMDSMAIKSCGSDSHGVIVCDPSPRHSPMGLGRSLDLRWLEKVAGGKNGVDGIKAELSKLGWSDAVPPISLHCERLGGLLVASP